MLIKTLLNKVERFKSFIYGEATFKTIKGPGTPGKNVAPLLSLIW